MKMHMRSIHAGERVACDLSKAKMCSSSSACVEDMFVLAGRKRRAAEAYSAADVE